MNSQRQVVVTGMGVVSPIGIGTDAFWDSLINGRCGVRVRDGFSHSPWPLKIYSPVMEFDGKDWVQPRKALKVMCSPIQFGYAAAMMALEQSELRESGVDPERVGTIFGTETFFSDPHVVTSVFQKCMVDGCYVHDRWGAVAMGDIEPLWMLKYLPNMVTSHISIAADARGPSNSICQAEASSILALIEGSDWIRRGVCDAVIVGGTGSQTSLSAMLYRGQHLLSHRTSEPERACRPFEINRDGTVYGEGAGAIVIENAEHARQRGAPVFGSIRSWSRTFHPPDTSGLRDSIALSLEAVLRDAEISATDLSHINAHASCQKLPDVEEAQAIRAAVGDTPVWGIKSNFGYLGPASGIIELIGSLISLQQHQIPPTLNYETPDPDCPVNINCESTKSDQTNALKISFSENGQIACVVI